MNDGINERILLIVNELFGGNVSAFARAVSVKQPTLNTILGERKSKPSFDVIYAIANADALNISMDWLVTGKGTMIKQSSEIVSNDNLNNDLDMDIKTLLDVIKRQNAWIDELEKEVSRLRDKYEPQKERSIV